MDCIWGKRVYVFSYTSIHTHIHMYARTLTSACMCVFYVAQLHKWMSISIYDTHTHLHPVWARVSYIRIGMHLRKHICSLPPPLAFGTSNDQRWQSVIPSTNHWLIIGTGRRVFGRQMQHIRVRSYLSPSSSPGPFPLPPRLPNIACQRGEEFWVGEIRLWRGPVDGALSRFLRRECIPLSKWHLYLTLTSASISF